MKVKLGQIIHITFYDHASMVDGDTTPLLFEVFGRVMEITPVHYRIATWVTPGAVFDDNAEYFSIIRGAITKVKVLK